MIRINLRPFRSERKKENIRQQASIFLLIVVFVVIALAWYNSRLNGRIEALDSQIAYTEKEIVRYKKIAKEVDELKEKLAILKQKLKIIENLDLNRKTAFAIMDTMTNMVIEKRMWFTQFKAVEEKVKKKKSKPKRGKKKKAKAVSKKPEAVVIPKVDIDIQGIALDNKTVADFMTLLQNEKLFSAVKLVSINQITFKQGKGRKGIELKKFHVTCKGVPMNMKSASEEGGKS